MTSERNKKNITQIATKQEIDAALEYHKPFTPDFLEQKKINNFGEIDRLIVEDGHAPIVTLEEFNRVQEIMESKRLKNPANKTGRKGKGKKPVSDVWCRLLVCACVAGGPLRLQ